MRNTLFFLPKKSRIFLLALLPLLIPAASVAQTNAAAAADAVILPWLGTWVAMDETPAPRTTVLEIRPDASGRGFDITTKNADQPVGESIIPDGVPRPGESQNCTGTRTYQWEKQAGVLLGTSEMVCQGMEAYNVLTLKMMTSADRMVDILVIKTADHIIDMGPEGGGGGGMVIAQGTPEQVAATEISYTGKYLGRILGEAPVHEPQKPEIPLDKLQTTELGSERVRKNLDLGGVDVVQWCREQIATATNIEKKGKNWYVTGDGCVITINAGSHTIITAHKAK